MRYLAILAILAILAAPLALAQSNDPVAKAAPTPPKWEAQATVAMCYQGCYRDYRAVALANIHRTPSGHQPCIVLQDEITGLQRCGSACESVWTAYGQPTVNVRKQYRLEIKDDWDRLVTHCTQHVNGFAARSLRIIEE